jgi:hypothetical protein
VSRSNLIPLAFADRQGLDGAIGGEAGQENILFTQRLMPRWREGSGEMTRHAGVRAKLLKG